MIAAAVRTCLHPDDWPADDRHAWDRALAARRGPFRSQGGGQVPANLYTRRKVASGYGRWLGFLQHAGDLELEALPSRRPTPDRLDAYFAHLRDCGNADHTIVGRFAELRMALQWMCPGVDFRWITQPHGAPIRSRLAMGRREGLVPDGAVLLAWAEELFRQGLALSKPRCRRAQVRDAVMVAILATRAPRLRALGSLRLGVHLRRQDDDAWILDQQPAITKRRRKLVLPLPDDVAVMLERYLAVERIELLNGRQTDAVWVSARGEPLAEGTISRRIRVRTKQRFGVAFGPHRFRHSLATTLALNAPENLLDASALLDHRSPETTREHYNRASALAAADRHGERLRMLRS